MLRTTVTTTYSAARPSPLGKSPSAAHTTAQGSSTVPVPSTGRASTTAITAASSRAYRCPSSQKPAASSPKVTANKMPWARSHWPKAVKAVCRSRRTVAWYRAGTVRRAKAQSWG